MKNKFVAGIGINDLDYTVCKFVNGKRETCPFYQKWRDMLKRCYRDDVSGKKPSYADCVVCEEWKHFSNFKSWMETQDWEGKQLDKDLLGDGKLYSPENCCFINKMTNVFILESSSSRGKYPIGVSFHNKSKKYIARCNNPFIGKSESLGYFNCPEKANQAWLKRKTELAHFIANNEVDEKIVNAIINRYINFNKKVSK